MLKRYHQVIGTFFKLIDALLIGSSWILAYWIRFYLPIIKVDKGFPSFEKYVSLTPLVITLWWIVFSSMKVYHSQRLLRRTHEIFLILKAHLVSLFIFISLTYLVTEFRYSRVVMIYFGILGCIHFIGLRIFLRNILRMIRKKGFNLRHAICVGEGSAIEAVIHKINRFPEIGIQLSGVFVHPQSSFKSIQKIPVLGNFSEISKYIQNNHVDQMIISLPRAHYVELDQILSSIKDEMIDIHIIPDIHEYVTLGCVVDDFEGLPIVHINDSPLYGWGAIAKRFTDIFLSALALVILSPLLLCICILIKFSSKGPVLYSQERMGIDGETFSILKFRSMNIDAETSTGAVWAKENDQRRTRLGTFLRSTSLDELPQLWNVLVGQMSLVGPRPERPVFVHQFKEHIPHYMLRHKVKAGITGWAQINGWRGNTSLERRIECDLYYIRNWSYFLDFKILFLTIWKGFINKNAY